VRVAGAAVAAVGGVALAVQGRINGQLGHVLHDGVLAALISFGIGTVLLATAVAATPSARAGVIRLRNSVRGGRLRFWQCLGGACGAFLVATQGITIATLGVAVFTIAVVAGQVVASLVVDRAGLGPGAAQPVTLPRAIGAALAVVAVGIAVSDHAAIEAGGLWWALLPAVAGLGLAWQAAVNGLVRMESDHIVVPTLVNFSVGTAALLLATLVDFAVRGLPEALPGQWWYYIGGPLGMITIMTAVAAVRYTGVLLLGLASVAGQLTGAVLLDIVVPTGGGLTVASVLGTAITMVAVGVAAIRR
jgi:transporter family-2 protein